MADSQFEKLCTELKHLTQFQETPIEYEDEDYEKFVVDGIRALYVDLNLSRKYVKDFDEDTLSFADGKVLLISEKEYILLKAHLSYYKTIQADVNNIVGYSTDSITITNADKPYANISSEMMNIERRLIDLFFKVKLEVGYDA